MAKPDMEVIKEIPGYKVILKAVLKSQIQQLVEQLASTTEEESVILTASVSDGTLCHLGSDSGKVFLEDHEDIKSQFLGFCLKRHHKQKQEKERKEAQEREEALARSMAPVTPPRYGGPRFMPRSPRYPSPQQGLHPVALSRVSPGGRMRSPGVRHQPYPMARPTRPSLNFDQQGPSPRMGNKIDGQIIKIEPEDDDDKSNQSVNDSVQTTSSVPGNSEPPSPSTKPSTPSQGQGPQTSDNDDAKSESSSSTIPNEASDLKYSDSVPPGGLSLDSDLSNLISPSDSNAHQAANSQDSSGEPQTPTGLDPNVSVKLEAVTESEMDLEITGVELGQNQMQDEMSSQEWMSNVQNVMQGASGSAADMASQQGYNVLTDFVQQLTPGYLGNVEVGKEGNKETEAPSDEDPVNNQCRFCQKCFASRRTLRIHQRLHTGEELFKCKMCGKSLATKQALEIHERIHTGERPYVCRYCNKGFSHKGNLKTHYVVHMK